MDKFISASAASRKLNIPPGRWFSLIHGGAITPDARLNDGTFLFREQSLSRISDQLQRPEVQL